jgi:hypothetical protein
MKKNQQVVGTDHTIRTLQALHTFWKVCKKIGLSLFAIIGNQKKCDDCGQKKAVVPCNGILVPPGTIGHFCADCYRARETSLSKAEPKPLGALLPS